MYPIIGSLKKLLPKKNQLVCIVIGVTLILLIRSYLVQVTYNAIWPKLTKNDGNDTSSFEPLTFQESFLFVILISFLF